MRATHLPCPVDITLAGFAHRFAAGHSLRLVIAATDAAYRAQQAPTTYGITIDSSSTLTIPVV